MQFANSMLAGLTGAGGSVSSSNPIGNRPNPLPTDLLAPTTGEGSTACPSDDKVQCSASAITPKCSFTSQSGHCCNPGRNCPTGYVWVSEVNWTGPCTGAKISGICAGGSRPSYYRSVCRKRYDTRSSGGPDERKFECCTAKYQGVNREAKCPSNWCPSGPDCRGFMQDYCTRTANRDKPECGCFQPPMKFPGKSMEMVALSPICYDKRCTAPEAYKYLQSDITSCQATLCSIDFGKLTVEENADFDMNLVQECGGSNNGGSDSPGGGDSDQTNPPETVLVIGGAVVGAVLVLVVCSGACYSLWGRDKSSHSNRRKSSRRSKRDRY